MSVTLGNPDLIHGTGVGVLHYLRAVTSWLSLGAELAYQASPQLPGGHVAVVSAAARIAKVIKNCLSKCTICTCFIGSITKSTPSLIPHITLYISC